MEHLFTPLGIDHLVIACDNNAVWSLKLQRLGFLRADAAGDSDAYFGIALMCGNVRIYLADPNTKRFIEGYIDMFLRRGNMQVLEVGIRVDSIRKANEECLARRGPQLIPECYFGDAFGDCVSARLSFHPDSVFQYKFIERREAFVPGIDHIAIAVWDLDWWVEQYKQWGFEVVYTPHKEGDGFIAGEVSAMRTYALRRGGWTVALVKGVDQQRRSQITVYLQNHGNHSVHHAALLCKDLPQTVSRLLARGIQFRLSRNPHLLEPLAAEHILHTGEDYGGSLLQCFTKPFSRSCFGAGGFFFELIERLAEKYSPGPACPPVKQAFHDPTVIGLFQSIEREEITYDRGLIFS